LPDFAIPYDAKFPRRSKLPRDNQGENGATNRMRMPLRGC
jgi:hypothetical protein